MDTTVRMPATFQLRTDLLNILQKKANAVHESIDTYVENLLMDIEYAEPNDETIEAIKEAQSGKYAQKLDMSSFDSFMSSVNAIK